MRIAAGVLLILVSLINGCAGAGVTILGGAASAISEAADEAANQGAANATTAEGAANAEEVRAAADELRSAGGMIMLLGVALLVLFGLQIAAAVCLFTSKAAKFIMVVGGLGILVPVLFFVMGDGNGNLVFTLISVAISALAIFAAVQIDKEGAPGGMAPAA